MSKRQQTVVSCCLFVLSLQLSACGPGQLFGPSITPTPTFTPSPTFTPAPTFTPTLTSTPRPTVTPPPSRTPTSTQPTSGRTLGITEDGQVFLIDYDYRYVIPLPSGSTVVDPQMAITGLPDNSDARFLAYVAPMHSEFLVVCYPSQASDVDTLVGTHVEALTAQMGVRMVEDILTNVQGDDVAVVWYLPFLPADEEQVFHNYEILFLVEDGYCATYSTLHDEPSLYSTYYDIIRGIAESLYLLDE